MSNIEIFLIKTAEQHPDDSIANRAMKVLRKRYDKKYGWCLDCDGLVTKESNCCVNRMFV